jgi:hypothetical protein
LFCVQSKTKGEVRLDDKKIHMDDKKIHIFSARRANVTGLGAGEPRAEKLALPKSVESGNIGLNKAVIRWMSLYHMVFLVWKTVEGESMTDSDEFRARFAQNDLKTGTVA